MRETDRDPLQFLCVFHQILPDTQARRLNITNCPSHLSGGPVVQLPPLTPGHPLPHLGVLLGHMLLGELGQLHQLRDDLLDVVAVGTVHQGGGHRVQDGLVRGLEAGGGG